LLAIAVFAFACRRRRARRRLSSSSDLDAPLVPLPAETPNSSVQVETEVEAEAEVQLRVRSKSLRRLRTATGVERSSMSRFLNPGWLDPAALEGAIQEACDAGVDDTHIDEGRRLLELHRQCNASVTDVDALQQAIFAAASISAAQSIMRAAEAKLQRVQKAQDHAIAVLQRASAPEDAAINLNTLQQAIDAATAANIATDAARAQLQRVSQAREEAGAELKAALQPASSLNSVAAQQAIDMATQVGVAASEVEKATTYLQRIQKARADAVSAILAVTSREESVMDLAALQQAIEAAGAAGVEVEHLEAARDTMQRVTRMRTDAMAAIEGVCSQSDQQISLTALQQAIEAANVAGVPAGDLKAVMSRLQRVHKVRTDAAAALQAANSHQDAAVDLIVLERAIETAGAAGVAAVDVELAVTTLQRVRQAREGALAALEAAMIGDASSIGLAVVQQAVDAAARAGGMAPSKMQDAAIRVLEAALARKHSTLVSNAAEADALQSAIEVVRRMARSSEHRSLVKQAASRLAEARAVDRLLLAVLERMGLDRLVPTVIKAGFTTCSTVLDLDVEVLINVLKLTPLQASELRNSVRDALNPPSASSAYEEVQVIGRGQCDVILARHRSTSRQVAIKQIMAPDQQSASRGLDEAMRMLHLRHGLLVECHTVFIQTLTLGRHQVNIVMEYCEGGDLAHYAALHAPLGEPRVLQLLTPVLTALAFVHSRGIAHRDIKPQNILLTADGRPKLADLGHARPMEASSSLRTLAGTVRYMAPEALQPGSSAAELWATDIWSFGSVLIELASGKSPSEDMVRTGERIEAMLDSIPTTFSPDFRAAAEAMLRLDPRQRPHAAELLALPLFAAHLSQAEPPAPSIAVLTREVEDTAWAVREKRLSWQTLGDGDVKICDCGSGEATRQPRTAEQRAARRLLELIAAAPGNADFEARYVVEKVVLASSRALSFGFMGHVNALNSRYANAPRPVFSLLGYDSERPDGSSYFSDDAVDETSVPRPMSRGTSSEQSAREMTLRYFMDTYLSLLPEKANVRVWLAFQATSSEMVARAILHGQFAKLSSVDPGYYGKGLYFTLGMLYALEEYGFNPDVHNLDVVPLLVCVVLVGNALPIVERPFLATASGSSVSSADRNPNGFYDKSLVAKADSHLVRVYKDPLIQHGCMPALPTMWPTTDCFTEVVLDSQAQVLPLGYVMVRRRQ